MTFFIEKYVINEHMKQRNGNSNTFVSYIVPHTWKIIATFIADSSDEAKRLFKESGYEQKGFRLTMQGKQDPLLTV